LEAVIVSQEVARVARLKSAARREGRQSHGRQRRRAQEHSAARRAARAGERSVFMRDLAGIAGLMVRARLYDLGWGQRRALNAGLSELRVAHRARGGLRSGER